MTPDPPALNSTCAALRPPYVRQRSRPLPLRSFISHKCRKGGDKHHIHAFAFAFSLLCLRVSVHHPVVPHFNVTGFRRVAGTHTTLQYQGTNSRTRPSMFSREPPGPAVHTSPPALRSTRIFLPVQDLRFASRYAEPAGFVSHVLIASRRPSPSSRSHS
ncbi:hypothetical protein B0H21DRAFT_818613 [Amylocystis lapponica]|nr:hypothetical protein B0H21DRAFT_818613 [Amylocystis lapponica]